jgi:hypothetical protein
VVEHEHELLDRSSIAHDLVSLRHVVSQAIMNGLGLLISLTASLGSNKVPWRPAPTDALGTGMTLISRSEKGAKTW